jgi:hypothetical protein
MVESRGSKVSCVAPPLGVSVRSAALPDGCSGASTWANDAPLSVEPKTPSCATFGGVSDPLVTEPEPWRPRARPIRMLLGEPGWIATAPIARSCASGIEPATSDHVSPPFVLL